MASIAQASTTAIARIPLARAFTWRWLAALGICGVAVLALGWMIVALFAEGIGVWGVNVPFVWGLDLINYAWWIGIANGASLFAAILVLRRHDLRTAVNRFAEAIALFAVIAAGIFPIIHLGRPWLWHWTFPFPHTFQVWPQFRSTLTWDFWAISTHAIVTTMLWYTGLIPDLATLRDRAEKPFVKRAYGIAALGWRGSVRHWVYHQAAYRLVAVLVLPLILVMQSTVAFEFAVTLVPDWHETRQPLHFVATGLASGLAMVMLVAVLLRRLLGLGRFIEDADLDLLGKLVLAASFAVAYVYAGEVGTALLAGTPAREAFETRLFGPYAGLYWAALALTLLPPQIFWFRWARLGTSTAVLVALAVNAGVWLDRFSIIVAGLQRDYLPSAGGDYAPTAPEWILLFGTLGLFAGLLLLFARFLPVVSMFETRHDEHEEERA